MRDFEKVDMTKFLELNEERKAKWGDSPHCDFVPYEPIKKACDYLGLEVVPINYEGLDYLIGKDGEYEVVDVINRARPYYTDYDIAVEQIESCWKSWTPIRRKYPNCPYKPHNERYDKINEMVKELIL